MSENKLSSVKPLQKIVVKKVIGDPKVKPGKKVLKYSSLLDKVQRRFNLFIRFRDKDQRCITCNRFQIEHAAHFYAAGHYTALRFNEDNVHGSCLQCNYYKHGSGNEYRRNIVKRIGEQRLLLLDSIATRNKNKRWERFELEVIYQEYSNKVKVLKQAA